MNRPGGAAVRRGGRAVAAGGLAGLACAAVSLAGHLVAGGARPSTVAVAVVLAGASLLGAVGSVVLRGRGTGTPRRRRWHLALPLLVAQPLLHAGFSTGHGHGGSHLGGLTGGVTPTADGSVADLLVVAHVLAALLTACLLAYAAWLRSQVSKWVTSLPALHGTGLTVSWVDRRSGVGTVRCYASLDVVASCAPRRGPPAALQTVR